MEKNLQEPFVLRVYAKTLFFLFTCSRPFNALQTFHHSLMSFSIALELFRVAGVGNLVSGSTQAVGNASLVVLFASITPKMYVRSVKSVEDQGLLEGNKLTENKQTYQSRAHLISSHHSFK